MTSGIPKGAPLTDPNSLWYATSGPVDAPMVIVGDFWNSADLHNGGRPFSGQVGAELDRILNEAGFSRDQIFCTTVYPGVPERGDVAALFEPGPSTLADLRPTPALLAALERLHSQLAAHRRTLVMAMGDLALWALTNTTTPIRVSGVGTEGKARVAIPSGITKMRGSQEYAVNHPIHDRSSSSIPVLPLIGPGTIMRQWGSRYLTVHDLRTRAGLIRDGHGWSRSVPLRLDYLPSHSRVVGQLATWLHASKPIWLSADIETKSNSVITCIGFADSADYAMSIPFVRIDDSGPRRQLVNYWSSRDEIVIRKMLAALFKAPHIKWIGQNFLYDYQYIQADWGFVPPIAHDTLIAQNLLFPGTPKALGHLSSLYCRHHRYWKDDNREWASTGTLEQHLQYNAEDAARTWEVAARQLEALKVTKLDKLWPFELWKFNLAWRMTRRGVIRDRAATTRVGAHIIERKMEVDRILHAIAPPESVWKEMQLGKVPASTWVSSPAQLAFLLYEIFGLPVQKDKKTKRPSTGKVALQALKDRFPRLRLFFSLLAESRSLGVIYGNAILSAAEPATGRMHGSFNPAGTETFRWSSSKNGFNRGMNMQNIPAGGDDWDFAEAEEEPAS